MLIVELDGHQYIEIGYYFAHLMLHAQALNILNEGKATPVGGSPASTTSVTDIHDQKITHMNAINERSTQILQRARRVEVAEMRVDPHWSLLISARH